MKKRIFGILLMGAMVVASMSMFTSCKDYDDDIQANKDDITALKTQLATLQTALTTAQSAATAAQSAADAAATAAKNAQTAADNAGTAAKNAQASADDAAKVASANATAIKAAQDAIAALEAQVAAFAKVEELNAVKADLEKAIADATAGKVSAEELTEALKPISAKITAIDESLNTLDGDVKALKEWKSTVEGQIATVQQDLKNQAEAIKALQEEIKNKITKGDLSGLANEDAIKAYVDNQLKAYAQNSEVSAAVANALKTYTTTADLQKMLAGYSTPAAVATAIENALKGYYTVAKTDEMISSLTTAINKAQTTANAAQTEEQVRTIAQSIADQVSAGAGEKINTLNVLVNKMLTSVTLIPQLYLNGIEAIQFISVQYIPQTKDYTIVPDRYNDATRASGLYINNGSTPAWLTLGHHQLVNTTGATAIRIDNGETEAYYRLSPVGVKQEDIDVDNIKFSCTTADTKTRAATLTDNNPVKPTFAKLENGVMTVKLNKTVTGSLNYDGQNNDKDVIASLMVPRKANADKGQDYAEIYSEFNLIDEITISPRIAALNAVRNAQGEVTSRVFNGNTATTKHDPNIAMQYHFIDSAKIWRSQVDKNVWVKEEIQYDKDFDLMTLVTGCYDDAAGKHTEITKEALAKYGLEFRFYVPTTPYGDASLLNYNFTDQQVFAKISGEKSNIISATLPSGTSALGNRAIIGKEPIVRVELIDVKRNNLLDMAYFKIKFVDNTPKKDPIKVSFEDEQTLSCTTNSMVIQWDKFIEQVYAKMEGTYGTGLSWQEFRSVYPAADVERDGVKFTNNTGLTGSTTYISSSRVSNNANRLGNVSVYWLSGTPTTESPAADANKLQWDLSADDIATILPAREKEVSTKITFVSNRPTDYGNIEMTLKLKVKLPDVPELTYYQNYWYDEYNSHYVLPVQYNTKAYYDQLKGAKANNAQYNPANIDAANVYNDEQGTRGAYCVYNNNLFNAFTFNQQATIAGGAANKYFNTPIPTIANYNCADWDFQFRLAQPDATVAAHPQYWTATATEPLKAIGVAGTYAQANAYTRPTTSWVTNLNGHAYGAYNLQTQIGTVYNDAIWMNWYDDDKNTNGGQEPGTKASVDGSWAWNVTDGGSRPYLFADHFNQNNQLLINEIKSNGIGKAPTFTHGKKIRMGMFLAWNSYNVELIKSYTICLVAPLTIEKNLKGFFEEGLVSGSFVNCAGAFSMVDFRGYEVAKAPATGADATNEFKKYRDRLFNYYECKDPVFDLSKVKYGMKYENGNVVVDNTVTEDNIDSKGLTAAQIEAYTNGNVVLSIDQYDPTGARNTQWLRFKNNGGSNVEAIVNVFIPATMNYGFGSETKYVKLTLYPRGQAPAAARRK